MRLSTAEKISSSEIPLRITSRRRWEPASGARETVSTPGLLQERRHRSAQPVQAERADGRGPAPLQNGAAQGDQARDGPKRPCPAGRSSFLSRSPAGRTPPGPRRSGNGPAGRRNRRRRSGSPGAPPADLREEHAAELGLCGGDRLVGREGVEVGGRAPGDPPGEGGIEGFPGGDPPLGIGGNLVETGGRRPRRSPAGSGRERPPVASRRRRARAASRKSGRSASPSPSRKRSKKSARGSGFRVTAMPPPMTSGSLSPRAAGFEGDPRHLENPSGCWGSRFRRRGRRRRCRNRPGAAAIRG